MSKNFTQEQKRQNNAIEARLSLPTDLSDDLYNEIMEVLQTTKFNKISFPLSSYRHNHDNTLPADDTRVITVGYIKKFDQKNNKFIVVLFNNAKAVIDGFVNPVIDVSFTQYNGKLGTITKLIIAPETTELVADDAE